jgi:hypothetical protein
MMRRIFSITVLTAVLAMVAAGVGSAARTQQELVCNGQTLTFTVTTVDNEHGVAWGVGTLSGGTHLIPTSFSGSLIDLTTGETLFSFAQSKGNGHAMRNATTISCTETDPAATAADFGLPPELAAPTDIVQFSLSVTAVWKP